MFMARVSQGGIVQSTAVQNTIINGYQKILLSIDMRNYWTEFKFLGVDSDRRLYTTPNQNLTSIRAVDGISVREDDSVCCSREEVGVGDL